MSSICGYFCRSSSQVSALSSAKPEKQQMEDDNQREISTTNLRDHTISKLSMKCSEVLNVHHVDPMNQIPKLRSIFQHLTACLEKTTFHQPGKMAFLVDRSFTILAITEEGLHLTGFLPHELLGREMAQMFPKDVAKHTKQAANMVEMAYQKGALFQHKAIKIAVKSGQTFDAHIAILPSLPDIHYFLAVITKEENHDKKKFSEEMTFLQQAITIQPTLNEIGVMDSGLVIEQVHYLIGEENTPAKAKSFSHYVEELFKPDYHYSEEKSFYLLDPSYHIVALTGSALEITGYLPQEILGQNLMNLVEISLEPKRKRSDSKKHHLTNAERTTPRSLIVTFFKKGYDVNLSRKSFKAELKVYDTKTTPYYLVCVKHLQDPHNLISPSTEPLRTFNYSSNTPLITPRSGEIDTTTSPHPTVSYHELHNLNSHEANDRKRIFGELFFDASLCEVDD